MPADLFSAAAQLQTVLTERGWKFCFIGGLAVQHWGRPRVTDDIDLTLLTGFGHEQAFIEELLRLYPARVEGAADFALQNRVLLLRNPEGFGVDIALGALEFEENAVNSASDVELLPGLRLRLCRAEDLVVMKVFANRALDWEDVVSVIRRQRGQLDWRYVFAQLEPLAELKEAPDLVGRLLKLKADEERKRQG